MLSSPTPPTLGLLCLLFIAWNEPAIPDPDVHIHEIVWPETYAGSGSYGRAVSGCWLDEAVYSTAVIRDGELYHLYSPLEYSAVAPLAGGLPPFTDVANLPFGVDTERDTLLATCAAGLVEFEFDLLQATWIERPLGSALWVGARRVLTSDMNASGKDEILGLTADGSSLIEYVDASTPVENPLPLVSPAIDFTVADYYAGGAKEFIVLAAAGVHIYDAAGNYLEEIRHWHEGGSLTVVENDTGPARLAWLTENVAGTQYLLQLFDESGFEQPMPLLVSAEEDGTPLPLDPLGLVAGDWDGDGWQDLVVPHRSFRKVTVLRDTDGQSNFTVDDMGDDHLLFGTHEDANDPAPQNEGIYAFSSLNRSSHDAIVAPQDVDGSLWVFRKRSDFEESTRTITDPEGGGSGGGGAGGGGGEATEPPPGFFNPRSVFTYDDVTMEAYLELYFDSLPLSLLDEHTHLQVIAWHQDDPVTPVTAPPLATNRIVNERFRIDVEDDPQQMITLTFDHSDLGGSYFTDGRHRYFVLRFVTLSQTNPPRIVSASHSILLGMATKEQPFDPIPMDYLNSLPGPEGTIEVSRTLEPGDPSLLGDEEVGAIVVLDYLPEHMEGVTPVTAPMAPTENVLIPWGES